MESRAPRKQLPLSEAFLIIAVCYFAYIILAEAWKPAAGAFGVINTVVQLLLDFTGVFLCFNISRHGRKADGVPFYFYFFAFMAAIAIDGLRGIETTTSGITPYGKSFIEIFINGAHIIFLILCSLALQGILESAVLRIRRQEAIIRTTPSSQRLHIFIALTYFVFVLATSFSSLISNITDNTARIIQILLSLSNGLLLGYLVSSVGSLRSVKRAVGDRRISTTQYVSIGFMLIIIFGFFLQCIEVSGTRNLEIVIQAPWMLGKYFILSGFIQINRASSLGMFVPQSVGEGNLT